METYNGHVRTPTDAIILFEACRLGILPRVQRRLSEKERQSIRSGSVFVWDEREAGMRRWTDGKSWSASRVSGSFLTYREMEGKRGGNSFSTPTANRTNKTPDSANDEVPDGEEGPDGYRYKPDGLMKQSFSITTSQGQHLHLISYYSRSHPTAQVLRQPSTDPALASIQPAKGMYPESTINDQSSVPAVTRSPMVGAPGYVVSPGAPGYHRPPPHHHPAAYLPPGYMPHPAYLYPISPMHTPPGHYALQPYPALPPGLPPLAYSASPYPHPQHPPQPHHPQPHHLALGHQAPPSSYDQRPQRGSESRSSIPPPPVGATQQPPSPYTPQSSAPPPMNLPQSSSQPPYSSSSSAPLTNQSQVPSQSPYQSQAAPPAPPAAQAPAQSPYQPSQVAHTASLPPPVVDSTSGRSGSIQIDPRLTAALNGSEAQTNGPAETSEAGQSSSENRQPETPSATSSHVPTITSLVHNIATSLPTEKSQGESEAERQGSVSPGGTRRPTIPQDIPSEKLGFREDKRALSKLDRVFARV
ncbi:hypothetical protein B0A52_00836 [Exophiala mesophila]|uniref:cAMP-independent regulatory protein pac2 n=1 Tax=Exophiala mesophila TaxID=212818 RepID=A0A438NIC4_EXOME|nr:hypothetical protein B0A52_00836 [Exophiala mesophila]